MNTLFYQQAKLMLQLLPIVSQEKCFALKGGTAINFFIREMPRLSVDIDLTYIPIEERSISLKLLVEATENIATDISKRFPRLKITKKYARNTNRLVKLFVNDGNTQVKIEPNELIRGSVFPCQKIKLVKKAIAQFNAFTSIQVLSTADLYAGKFCAALDRQHPRDLFDIKHLLENEGITQEIHEAFIVYLISHGRPISELLNPHKLNLRKSYQNDFLGITDHVLTYDDFISVRDHFFNLIKNLLTEKEKHFLLSFKKGMPDWEALRLKNIEKFPAIQWKLLNIRKLKENNIKKHHKAVEKLKKTLYG